MTPEEQLLAIEEERRAREVMSRGGAGPVASGPVPGAPVPPPGGGKPNWRADDRARALDMYDNLSSDIRPVSDITNTPQVSAPDYINTSQAAAGGDVSISPDVRGVTAAQPGAAYANVQRVQDTAGQQVRGMQMDNVTGRLQAAADGLAPSAAENMVARQAAEAQSQVLGMAGQARGNQAAAARRDALRASGKIAIDGALAGAQMRAAEMATARGQLTDAYGNIRGVDTQTAMQDAADANTTNRANTAGQNTMSAAGADRTLAADQFTAGAGNRRDEVAAGIEGDNANRRQTGNQFNAGETNTTNRFNTTTKVGIDTANADRTQRTNETNLGKDVSVRGQNISGAATASDAVSQTTRDKTAESIANKGADKALIGAGIGAASGAGAMLATKSDRRSKENIDPIRDADATEFIDSLADAASAYDYIDPSASGADEGRQYGIIAQELAKSRIGRSVLTRMPDGKLGVQPDRLTMALAGVVAKLAKEAR